MIFGFGKKKKQPPQDPLAAYDRLIEDLERQASAIRRSAATLLSLRGELAREVERQERKASELEGRLELAMRRQDSKAQSVLQRDQEEGRRALTSAIAARAGADDDARLLMEAAQELSSRIGELKAERTGARARLKVGMAVSVALQERAEKIDRVLALDAARDEVEKAHALAEIYRDEAMRKA